MSKRKYDKADKVFALKLVDLCEGNVSAASRETGIPRVTILGWLKERENQADGLEMSDDSTVDERLPIRQRKFVNEVAQSGNATDAARKAGYAFPQVEGSRLLANPRIRARIEARLEAAESLTQGEIKGTLTQQMRADLDDFVNDNGYFSLDKCRENGVTSMLKRLDYDEFGSVKKFEVYSAQTAAKELARITGLTQPKTQQFNQINVVYVNDWRSAEHIPAESTSGSAGGNESGPPI